MTQRRSQLRPAPFRLQQHLVPALLLLSLSLLAGCGFSAQPGASPPGVALQGRVHGGQQAVSGATIALYAAGATGNGTGAVNLLGTRSVTTDQYGGFNITGDYTCPTATTQVYLVARGGNPGLAANTSNPALVLMAPLGDCGNLTQSTFIAVNEVTTVASAWTLAQFLGPGAVDRFFRHQRHRPAQCVPRRGQSGQPRHRHRAGGAARGCRL